MKLPGFHNFLHCTYNLSVRVLLVNVTVLVSVLTFYDKFGRKNLTVTETSTAAF